MKFEIDPQKIIITKFTKYGAHSKNCIQINEGLYCAIHGHLSLFNLRVTEFECERILLFLYALLYEVFRDIT